MKLSLLRPFKKKLKKPAPANFKQPSHEKGSLLVKFQKLGRSLMYPIAVLPFAALLNRFGALGVQVATEAGHLHQADWWIATIIQTPGATVFNNLPILFAIGVGFGLADDNRGEAALVSALLYLILAAFTAEGSIAGLFYNHVLRFTNSKTGAQYSALFYLPKVDPNTGQIISQTYVLDVGVLGGIVSGGFSALFYNKWKHITLPDAISFFGGRRFIPMVVMLFSLPMSFTFAIIWPWIQYVLVLFGTAISHSSEIAIPGAFAYGVINRLMQPFGLHHILNTFLWFQLPVNGTEVSFDGTVLNTNVTVNGDINAFNKGIAQAGTFQSGYFPLFMGGEPGIAIAMVFAVKKGSKRKEVASFLFGVAGVAFLTGIDEPLVFSFIFVSPLLWVIYAFYTGISNAIVIAMHVHLGFGFSAGFIDYVISFAQSWGNAKFWGASTHSAVNGFFANPLWIFPVSAFMFCLFFFTFLTIIKKYDIKTPGREGEGKAIIRHGFDAPIATTTAATGKGSKKTIKLQKYAAQAKGIYQAIGGHDNIETINNCATRLRLVVKDNVTHVDDAQVKANGGIALVRLGKKALQIIIGTHVEAISEKMLEIHKSGGLASFNSRPTTPLHVTPKKVAATKARQVTKKPIPVKKQPIKNS